MGIRSIDHDTVPCPPPEECGLESGEYASVAEPSKGQSSHVAPRFASKIEQEVQERLATVRCPQHGQPARANLSFSQDGAVQVIPVACCGELEQLIFAKLRDSVTLAPPASGDLPELPDFTAPRIPR
jgi:hypothetical protein